jgi:hypothetical protein
VAISKDPFGFLLQDEHDEFEEDEELHHDASLLDDGDWRGVSVVRRGNNFLWQGARKTEQ